MIIAILKIILVIMRIIVSGSPGFEGRACVPGLKKKRGVGGGRGPPPRGVGGGRAPPHLQMVVILVGILKNSNSTREEK